MTPHFCCQVYFPISAGYLYYIVCFDFLKSRVYILDSRAGRVDVLHKYIWQCGHTYLKQKAGDHFPLPDPNNTYVNWPDQKENWLMNSSVHHRITSTNPGNVNVSPSSRDEEGEGEDEEEGEENEEAPTQQGEDGAGTSTSRRRNRWDRLEEDIDAINNRLDSVELNM